MANKKEVWICDICKSEYKKYDDAIYCEKHHPSTDAFTIKRLNYDKVNETYGLDRGIAQNIPKEVTLSWGDNFGDFAIYRRVQIGPKGI